MGNTYENGYESAKNTVEAFSHNSNKMAIGKYYDSLVNKRNSQNPMSFDCAEDYDDLMDWYDGALDFIESFLKNK